MTDKT